MDLQYFLNILLRRKWLILAVALIAAATAFWFVDQQEDKYKATATLSTGIVDVTPDLSKENPWIQQFFVDMGLGKLQEFMGSQRNMSFLTYRLLIHDLDEGVTEPFRTPVFDEENPLAYSQTEINELRELLKEKVVLLDYTLNNEKMERIYKSLTEAYGYDYQSLIKDNISISRKGDTDLLQIQFISENPKLSHFATNSFCKDFLNNYNNVQREGEVTSVNFLSEQAKEKKQKVDSLRRALENFQNKNSLADIDDQRNSVINQIAEMEEQKIEARQKVTALKASIRRVDQRINEASKLKEGDEGLTRLNAQNIETMRKRIDELNDEYIRGGMKDERVKKQLDLTRQNLDKQLEKLAKSRPTSDDRNLERRIEGLLNEKIKLETELDEMQEIKSEADGNIAALRGTKQSFVSSDAYINQKLQELKVAETQYELIFSKYSKEKLNLDNTILPVKIFEHAQLPDKAEPKMKAVITGFSGIVGATLASVIIFLLAFLDYSINTPHKFKRFTNLPLLGSLNKVKAKKLDFQKMFSSNGQNAKVNNFKEAVRNLRYTIENAEGNKILFTSTKPGEGKTFLIIALAHALRMKNKRVLLIDTNFKNNTLTKMSQENMNNGVLSSRLIGEANLDDEFEPKKVREDLNLSDVDIIGNKGSYQSPSEVFADKDFNKFLSRVEDSYDYIIMESAALNQYTDTKELTSFVDLVVAVFAADSEIKESDKNSIQYLKSLGNKFLGAVLNKVDLKNIK